MILGMAWCKWISVPTSSLAALTLDDLVTNVYLLIDYGDFVDGTTKTDKPYVQLLPMTDPAAAHADFVATRLSGKDTTGSQHNSGSGSGSGQNNNDKGAKGFFEKYKIPILAAAGVAGALLLVTTAFILFRSRKPAYRPLFEPAPAGSMQMHAVSGYNTGAPYGYNTGAPYADPWNRGR